MPLSRISTTLAWYTQADRGTRIERAFLGFGPKRQRGFGFLVPQEGDIVTAGQCRPLAKTVRFNVVKVDSCLCLYEANPGPPLFRTMYPTLSVQGGSWKPSGMQLPRLHRHSDSRASSPDGART